MGNRTTGVRVDRRRRLRRIRDRGRRALVARTRLGRPDRGRSPPRGCLHGAVQPQTNRSSAARRTAAAPRWGKRHRHPRHPVGEGSRSHGCRDRRLSRKAGTVPRSRRRHHHQLPRRRLRRGAQDPRRRRRHPRHHRGKVLEPQRICVGLGRKAGGDRHAGRRQGRTQPGCTAVQTRHHPCDGLAGSRAVGQSGDRC